MISPESRLESCQWPRPPLRRETGRHRMNREAMQISSTEEPTPSGEPLVSVIVPAARVDQYLYDALKSVFTQDYLELEVVLILDGVSPDELPLPLGGPCLRILSFQRRQGTPVALNAGLLTARGNFIARLDADDLALPGRFTEQVEYLRRHPAVGCVGSEVLLIEEDGSVVGPGNSYAQGDNIGSHLVRRNVLVHSSVMYRSSIVEQLGGYTLSMQRMQDYDLFLRMARISTLAILPMALTAYRVHRGQFSRLTSPWKSYTWNILRERRLLAKHLGISSFGQAFNNMVWHVAQVLRYYNLRRPGFRRPLRSQ